MRRFIDIATIFFVTVVLVAVFLHSCQRQQLRADIASLSDTEYIINNLKIRGADDCKVTPIEGGWKCTELKSNKSIYADIRRPSDNEYELPTDTYFQLIFLTASLHLFCISAFFNVDCHAVLFFGVW